MSRHGLAFGADWKAPKALKTVLSVPGTESSKLSPCSGVWVSEGANEEHPVL